MIEFLINILGSSYSIPGFVVALYLVVAKGPKWVRWFLRNFAGTWQDWLFLPLIALPTFFAVAAGLSLASALWPVTGFLLIRDAWKKRRELKRAESEEFEGLLEAVQEDRKELESAPHNS